MRPIDAAAGNGPVCVTRRPDGIVQPQAIRSRISSPAEVARGLTEGRILLVDVREPNETAVESYPDAVLMPLSQFDPAGIPDPAGKQVVFACGSGKRSTTASLAAQEAGLPYDAHLEGGMTRLERGRAADQELRESRPMRRLSRVCVHSGCARSRARRWSPPQTKKERVVNIYNWSDYIDPAVIEDFTKDDRHQGALRHLRFQRHAGNEAADRQIRL